jgi:hypothetical protein
MSDASFDPMFGWIMLSDVHESDTTASLKEVIAALKRASNGATLSDEIYDDAERLLYTWFNLIRQGVRERFTKQHVGVSWYLTERDAKRALISYQDGPGVEWCNECYADEVPLWLLVGLFRRIWRRKPLGDQKADETIAQTDKLDAEYGRAESVRNLDVQLGRLSVHRGRRQDAQ